MHLLPYYSCFASSLAYPAIPLPLHRPKARHFHYIYLLCLLYRPLPISSLLSDILFVYNISAVILLYKTTFFCLMGGLCLITALSSREGKA